MEEWKSPRRVAAEEAAAELAVRKANYAAFDRLVDLALDGTIELSEAIEAYKFDGLLFTPESE